MKEQCIFYETLEERENILKYLEEKGYYTFHLPPEKPTFLFFKEDDFYYSWSSEDFIIKNGRGKRIEGAIKTSVFLNIGEEKINDNYTISYFMKKYV